MDSISSLSNDTISNETAEVNGTAGNETDSEVNSVVIGQFFSQISESLGCSDLTSDMIKAQDS